MRFILNLRDLNSYIKFIYPPPPHFKLEDWHTVVRLMFLGFKMATISISRMPIFWCPFTNRSENFFQWRGIYEFISLPFGLSVAPFIFTKVLRLIVKSLRRKFSFNCLSRWFFTFRCLRQRMSKSNNIHASMNFLTSLGFLINYDKSLSSHHHLDT